MDKWPIRMIPSQEQNKIDASQLPQHSTGSASKVIMMVHWKNTYTTIAIDDNSIPRRHSLIHFQYSMHISIFTINKSEWVEQYFCSGRILFRLFFRLLSL